MSDLKRKLVIVTGLSGAGKTTCLGLLEDIGYFCVDNIPPQLLNDLIGLFRQMDIEKMALGIDARWKQNLESTARILNTVSITEKNIDINIIFLEAKESEIERRYALTRRKHPLQDEGDVRDAYIKEKNIVAPIREISDHIVDTSNTNSHQLREKLKEIIESYSEKTDKNIKIRVVSFGFKHGTPVNGDFIIDCRFLPNPYWIPGLSEYNGTDTEIIEFFSKFEIVDEYLNSIKKMLEIAIERYEDEGRSSITVCVGCSGGKHRSVFFAEKIAEYFRSKDYYSNAEHRDWSL